LPCWGLVFQPFTTNDAIGVPTDKIVMKNIVSREKLLFLHSLQIKTDIKMKKNITIYCNYRATMQL